jgi:threonyl-tRNA synthetase
MLGVSVAMWVSILSKVSVTDISVLIVGDKEEQNKAVSVRSRSGENIGQITVEEFVALTSEKIVLDE